MNKTHASDAGNVATTVALVHSTMQRLAQQSASCKLWSVLLASLVLAMVAGRPNAELLLWAVTPTALLALADAAYTIRARSLVANATQAAVSVEDLLHREVSGLSAVDALKSLGGLLSLSVWPFYLALFGGVFLLGNTVLAPPRQTAPQAFPRPQATLGSSPGASNPFAQPLRSSSQPSFPTTSNSGPNIPPGAFPPQMVVPRGDGQRPAPSQLPSNSANAPNRPNFPPFQPPSGRPPSFGSSPQSTTPAKPSSPAPAVETVPPTSPPSSTVPVAPKP